MLYITWSLHKMPCIAFSAVLFIYFFEIARFLFTANRTIWGYNITSRSNALVTMHLITVFLLVAYYFTRVCIALLFSSDIRRTIYGLVLEKLFACISAERSLSTSSPKPLYYSMGSLENFLLGTPWPRYLYILFPWTVWEVFRKI